MPTRKLPIESVGMTADQKVKLWVMGHSKPDMSACLQTISHCQNSNVNSSLSQFFIFHSPVFILHLRFQISWSGSGCLTVRLTGSLRAHYCCMLPQGFCFSFWPDPALHHPAGETDEGGESFQAELDSRSRVEISNIQFMLANPFCIHTVCKQ